MKHMPHVAVSPRVKKVFRRSTILVVGIAITCGLLYLAVWLLLGNQRQALQVAGVVFCGLLAVAVLLFTIGELVE